MKDLGKVILILRPIDLAAPCLGAHYLVSLEKRHAGHIQLGTLNHQLLASVKAIGARFVSIWQASRLSKCSQRTGG